MGASLQSLGVQAKPRTNLVEYVDGLIPENNKSYRESLIQQTIQEFRSKQQRRKKPVIKDEDEVAAPDAKVHIPLETQIEQDVYSVIDIGSHAFK